MPADPHSIPAKLLIDDDALAALRGTSSPDIAPLLERVAGLLADVRTRLDSSDSILVDADGAGRLLGVSPKTLINHSVPAVLVGSRRLYRRATLEQWARERESAEPAGVTR